MSSLKGPGRHYWRSLAELSDEPAARRFIEHEFPGGVTDVSGFSRRRFVQLLGASSALASGAGCRWPKENILPHVHQPHGHDPGVEQHFATHLSLLGVAQPLMVTSYDGRPIKIEGNQGHPMSQGAAGAFAQASILELYDPDRSKACQMRDGDLQVEKTFKQWADAMVPVRQREQLSGGRGLRVLSEASGSPTVARLQRRLQQLYPRAQWITYEPLGLDNARRGASLAFGEPLRPLWALGAARVVVTLDDDPLVAGPQALRAARDFAQSRRPGSDMSRLYALESRFSATGAAADHRCQLAAADVYPALCQLVRALAKRGALRDAGSLAAFAAPAAAAPEVLTPELLRALAGDLAAHPGASAIFVGAGQPAHVHALAALLNVALQNVGRTVTYLPEEEGGDAVLGSLADGHAGLRALSAEMERGEVSTLLVLGGNPAFNAPEPERFVAALAKVPTSCHLSLYDDETSRACGWHLSRAHYLESWGDGRAWDGSICLQQPLIQPLYEGHTTAEVLATWLAEADSAGLALTRATLAELFPAQVTAARSWRDTVRRGFVSGSATGARAPSLRAMAPAPAARPAAGPGEVELTFWPDSHVFDGRFANNGWLQELPDYMTKLTWDNVAQVGPETAAKLGIKHQGMVRLQHGGASLDIVAYIMPGQPPGTVALTLGYGRREAGVVGGSRAAKVKPSGFDTYPLWPGTADNFVAGAKLTVVKGFYEVATTQDHHSMDQLAKDETQARVGEIVREAGLQEFLAHPDFARERVEHPPLESPWQEIDWAKSSHRWGMSIDLSTCVGCNACVVACQAENNIPIVGKEQVIRGREMHWLRIDRYFVGDEKAPKVAAQPMMCQQCELAPCESVCPVAATVHSHEGLNDMVYNRCIGTRYCSNNCPYKVRRFNFFNYHKNLVDPANQVAKMVYNPEVTVRARGVMEKCTYCVQRIAKVRIAAKNEGRALTDGEFTTACQQTCPTHAIVVGDLNDPRSQVSQKHKSPRSYAVLEQLNTKPRTEYEAAVRNPHPELT